MSLRIALLMMQKNERLLLDHWIAYHRTLVGPASIFIFDNGSTDPQTLTILRAGEASGLSVNRSHDKQKDYYDRGIIFANLIKQLDATNPHDFYFPMDCDEFLACEMDGKPSCQRSNIERTLEKLKGSEKVLSVPHKHVNSPYHKNRYSKIAWCRKCFFARDACESLSDGFHEGRSHLGEERLDSDITYFEFHYKPYSDHLRLSQQKVEYLLPDLKRRTLFEYAKKKRSNHHAAVALLQSEYTYLRSFDKQTQTHTDSSLLQRFAELGIDSTALFDSSDNQNNLRRAMLLARHLQLQAWDAAVSLYYGYRSMGSAIKRLLRQ